MGRKARIRSAASLYAVQKILETGVSIRQFSRITGISKAVIERFGRNRT